MSRNEEEMDKTVRKSCNNIHKIDTYKRKSDPIAFCPRNTVQSDKKENGG